MARKLPSPAVCTVRRTGAGWKLSNALGEKLTCQFLSKRTCHIKNCHMTSNLLHLHEQRKLVKGKLSHKICSWKLGLTLCMRPTKYKKSFSLFKEFALRLGGNESKWHHRNSYQMQEHMRTLNLGGCKLSARMNKKIREAFYWKYPFQWEPLPPSLTPYPLI